ncbi:MAG: family 16 glycosylhydrolase [Clostridia bacterium]|nr:family 16 glycosylhydrolase [Clostridia bacterium]
MLRKVFSICFIVLLAFGMSATVSVSADATADLVVTALTWQGGDGQVKPNTALTFSVTVKNQGEVAVTEPFTVDVGFGTERLFRLTHANRLAVGGEVTLTTPAWTATAGDRMVTARVNSTDTIVESERWDNDTLQRNLRIAADRYAPTYDAVRGEVEKAGMFDLTFNDDFNDVTYFDKDVTGREGYKWYVRRHSAFPLLKPEDYRTENGILTMDCAIDTFALGAATIDRITGVGYTFTHGYLEFRLRAPVVGGEDESKIAIWSFPRERYTEKEKFVTHVEMDWLEYYGNNYYTVMLHEQSVEQGRWDWYSSTQGSFNGLGDQQWHVMGYLWEEGSLRCFLDGKEFYTLTWGPDEMPMPINEVKKGDIKFDGVFSYADTQDMMLFLFGSAKIPLELDYVRIWQHGGENPKVPLATTTKATATTKPTVITSAVTTVKKPSANVTTGAAVTTATTTQSSSTMPTTDTSTTGVITTVASAKEPASFPWGWLLAAVAVLAAAAVAAVWILRKRKQ